MSERHPAESKRPIPRLYLATPPVEDAIAMASELSEAVAAADVAAVLLRLPAGDERGLIKGVKALLGPVQDAGAALLLDGNPEIVARAGADGAHFSELDAFLAAVESLKPARIAGCGGLKTRHDAMTAAERGADYVMFGEPEGDRRPAFDAIIERINWWAEVFQIPCVGFAASLDEVEPLAAAGADFVAIGPAIWQDAGGAAAAVRAAAQRIAGSEALA